MQITIVAAPNITTEAGGKGRPYKKMEVLYRSEEGKVMTKTLVSFKNPDVFKNLASGKVGDVFDIDSFKNEETGYWDWKSATLSNGEKEPMNKEGEVTKDPVKKLFTELDRQHYIVRQSSLERAIETLSGNGPFTADDVEKLAGRYEAWVFRVASDTPSDTPVATPVAAQVPPRKSPGRPKKVVNDDVDYDPIANQDVV